MAVYYTVGGKLATSGGKLLYTIKQYALTISAGSSYTLMIDNSNLVWSWGYNLYGTLGDNTNVDKHLPIKLYGNKTFCQISSSKYDYYSQAIDKNGKSWGWGGNNKGVYLGDNTYGVKSTPVAVCGNHTFCKIETGNLHTIAIDNNGKLWCWGFNDNGQLGNNNPPTAENTPISITSGRTFCKISCGYQNSAGIDKNGKLWTWGYNLYGQLGNNSTSNKSTPFAIGGVNKTFCEIYCGQFHMMALDFNGKSWTWGYNSSGQLGDNTNLSKNTPVSVYGNKTFCKISVGGYHSIGIDYNGKIWSWGRNLNGQLGNQTIVCEKTPVMLVGINKTFCKISGGNINTISIDKYDKMWGWGYNNYGQLGDNSTIDKCTPISIVF
jgi:alpha-tubulin suppressor-like RCC1 family protein